MINDASKAKALAEALRRLETARTNLENAPEEELVDRANEYEGARREATPVFAACQEEFGTDGEAPPPAAEGDTAPEEQEDHVEREASPGVPLVQPPGVVVSAGNLSQWGPLVTYQVKEGDPENPEAPKATVRATPYAFSEGTAVETAEGRVATNQPSRLILGEGGALAVVANDVFNQAYERVREAAGDKPLPGADPAAGEGGAA